MNGYKPEHWFQYTLQNGAGGALSIKAIMISCVDACSTIELCVTVAAVVILAALPASSPSRRDAVQ